MVKMKMSFIKYDKDKKNFKIPELLGWDVFYLHDLEEIDNKIKELIQKDYDTIVVSDQVASFSQDMIKKYKNNNDIKIIISLNKE